MVEVTIAVPTHDELVEQYTVDVDYDVTDDPTIPDGGRFTAIVGGRPGDVDGVIQQLVVDSGGSKANPSQFADEFVQMIEGRIASRMIEGSETSERQIFESVDPVYK